MRELVGAALDSLVRKMKKRKEQQQPMKLIACFALLCCCPNLLFVCDAVFCLRDLHHKSDCGLHCLPVCLSASKLAQLTVSQSVSLLCSFSALLLFLLDVSISNSSSSHIEIQLQTNSQADRQSTAIQPLGSSLVLLLLSI